MALGINLETDEKLTEKAGGMLLKSYKWMDKGTILRQINLGVTNGKIEKSENI